MTAPAVNLLRCMQDRNRYLAHRVEALERALAKRAVNHCERCDRLPADCRCEPCQKFLDSFLGMEAYSEPTPTHLHTDGLLRRVQRALRKVL